MGGFLGFKELRAVAVCDVHEAHPRDGPQAPSIPHQGNNDCASVKDFREITDRKDIDASLSAPQPDHWHAIITVTAMKNGQRTSIARSR